MIIVTVRYYADKKRKTEIHEIDADDMVVVPGANMGESVLVLNKNGKQIAVFSNWDSAIKDRGSE